MALCRFTKACCPQQAIDEYTPDAWHELLGDLDFEDCKQAIIEVAKRQPFVAPAEIRQQVRLIRHRRLEVFERRHGQLRPPAVFRDDVQGEIEWDRNVRSGILSGQITEPSQIDWMGDPPPALGGKEEQPASPEKVREILRRVRGDVENAQATE